MLQANMLDDRSLTAASHPTIQTDFFERTLSFDSATGNFTFGVETLDNAGLFRIRLTAAKKNHHQRTDRNHIHTHDADRKHSHTLDAFQAVAVQQQR